MAGVAGQPEDVTSTRLLLEREVAAIFAVTPRTIRRWAAQGLMHPVRIAGTTRYRMEDIAGLVGGETMGTR